jgi:hypothetical protein
MSGSIGFSDSALLKRGMYGTMGGSDYWFIGASATATNSGYIEIATGDDGTEPIYIRQYGGDPYTTGTVARTATILDGSGNTTFPNTLTATTLVKSGGTSLQYLMADGSVSTITNNITGTGTINELAYFNSSSTIASLPVATYPSLTELSYVKGVTSAIQTQINTKQATISLTTTGTSGAATFASNVLNIPNYGSALSGYLPLTGGTLTGALSGTTASFSSNITASGTGNIVIQAASSNNFPLFQLLDSRVGGNTWNIEGGRTLGNLQIRSSIAGATVFEIAGAGAATFSSSVTALKYIANSQATYASLTYEETFKYASSPAGIWFGNSFNSNSNVGLQLRVSNDGTSVQALTITPTGNVGIGTSSPNSLLTLRNSGTNTQLEMATESAGSSVLSYDRTAGSYKLLYLRGSDIQFNPNDSNAMTVKVGGNVLIATSTDNGEKLYVNGAIRATGNITANSDLTLKKNLKLIDNPIDKLMQLNGYSYQWKENDEYQYGVVAQEVEKVLPYAVQTGNNKIKGVAYNQLTPLLIEGFKSHESEITILKARVKYLESKLA